MKSEIHILMLEDDMADATIARCRAEAAGLIDRTGHHQKVRMYALFFRSV